MLLTRSQKHGDTTARSADIVGEGLKPYPDHRKRLFLISVRLKPPDVGMNGADQPYLLNTATTAHGHTAATLLSTYW